MAASGLMLQPLPVENFKASASRHCMEPFSPFGNPFSVLVRIIGPEPHLPLEVCPTDTIASVKIQIQVHRGFYVDQQRLVYEGRELSRNERQLLDYGVNYGDVLHLVLRISDLVGITVKTSDGRTLDYRVRRTCSVRDLKKTISEGTGDFPGEQLLSLRGVQLKDSVSVDDLPLTADTVLCLHVQKATRFCQIGNLELDLIAAEKLSPSSQVDVSREDDEDSEVDAGSSLKWPVEFFKDSGRRYSSLQRAAFHFRSGHSKSFGDLLRRAEMGLTAGQVPKLTAEGSGGVYLMKDEYGSENVAVFKPSDEEPMAVNNPRGFSSPYHGEGLKRGTRSGEGAFREVAAYILDHCVEDSRRYLKEGEEGFSGVPPTALVECYNEAFNYSPEDRDLYRRRKVGSLQQFVHSLGSCEDMGSSLFPVEEVHKITVLDMRLANTDRNGGNILVCRGKDAALKLVPIDHGYCLPDKFEDCTFEWLYWPQAGQPYGPSALKYIESLDAEQDIGLLRQCGWTLRPQVARVLRVSTMVLKKGAAAGLTPFQIGSILSRGDCLDSKSPIESIVEEAEALGRSGTEEFGFLRTMGRLLDAYIATVDPPSFC